MKTSYLNDLMTDWRQDFHRHPELGFNEHRTSARVAELLEGFGVDVYSGIGGTELLAFYSVAMVLAALG